jgi:hypothetical protein
MPFFVLTFDEVIFGKKSNWSKNDGPKNCLIFFCSWSKTFGKSFKNAELVQFVYNAFDQLMKMIKSKTLNYNETFSKN